MTSGHHSRHNQQKVSRPLLFILFHLNRINGRKWKKRVDGSGRTAEGAQRGGCSSEAPHKVGCWRRVLNGNEHALKEAKLGSWG